MKSAPPRWLLTLALLAQTFISAGTFLVAASAMKLLAPAHLALLRFVMASVAFAALLPLLLPRGARLPPARLRWRVLVLGVVAVPVNQGFFLYGLHWSTPAHAALLYSLTPLLVMFLAQRGLGERLSARELLGALLAFGGTTWLLAHRGLHLDRGLAGDLLVLVAVIAWALYAVLGKPLVAEVGAVAATAWSYIAGTLVFLPLGLFLSRDLSLASISAPAWGGLVYLALLTSVVSYLCWYWALGYLEAGKVAIFTNLQPIATALLSWAVLGEHIGGAFVGSALLVLAGVWLVQRG